MKGIATLAIAAALLAACNNADNTTDENKKDSSSSSTPATTEPAHNTLTDAEKSEGWKLLFDGTTTNGWHVFNKKTDGHAWVVDNGTLHFNPKEFTDSGTVGGGDLVSEEEFDNFDFRLEWKVADSANSGIILFINESPKYKHTWYTGPEMQVLDNNGHPDAKITKHRAGDLYDLISASPETVKKANEWNQVQITSKDSTLEFYLNGTKVLSTKMWDDNWKKLIKGSKFKGMPDFGTYKKGRIGIQDHGNKVWYRNIKIRNL